MVEKTYDIVYYTINIISIDEKSYQFINHLSLMNFQFGMNIYNTNKINKMFYINYRKGASPVLHQYDVCGRSLHGRRQYNCWNSSICVSGRRRVPNYLGNWHLVFIFGMYHSILIITVHREIFAVILFSPS